MTDPDCQDQGTMPQRGKVAKGNSWTKDDFFLLHSENDFLFS